MPEPLILLVGLALAGLFVLAPLRAAPRRQVTAADHEAALLRHHVALEALRDVETDHRAGSLDGTAYEQQLAEAEHRAATTRVALEAAARTGEPNASPQASGSRSGAAVLAAAIALVLLIGSLVPALGVANGAVLNEPLAAARRAEEQRQDRLRQLSAAVASDPRDAAALSDLADAYLAGSSQEDLVRAAVSLRLLIDLDPERADAYERIITAYIRADDYANARAALEAYEEIATASEAEVAFFAGLIALRGDDDPATAVAAFDRFLELAPRDDRAAMVRGLREEAAAR